METAGDAAHAAQLLIDPTQTGILPAGFLLPYVGLALGEIRTEITNRAVTETEGETVIAAFPAGTQSLDAYMAPGGPLETMLDPVAIEEKPAGTTNENYTQVRRVGKLPDRTQSERERDYEWVGGRVLFTGATQDLDLWIRYQAAWPKPQAVTEATPLPLAGLTPTVARWATALVAGAMDQLPTKTDRLADAKRLLYKWINGRVMESQRTPRRPRPFRRSYAADGADGLV